jgi:RimJ/RimL family protein N-acetyltransferase
MLKHNNILVRYATIHDAKKLCVWWNDGSVMAHAGFPDGINTTEERVRELISKETGETIRRFIIEVDGICAGEMNYRNKGGKIAEIGIKICESHQQNKGYGTVILKMFIDFLFDDLRYDKRVVDTKLHNEKAQHVYEKLGFKKVSSDEEAVFYELGSGK